MNPKPLRPTPMGMPGLTTTPKLTLAAIDAAKAIAATMVLNWTNVAKVCQTVANVTKIILKLGQLGTKLDKKTTD